MWKILTQETFFCALSKGQITDAGTNAVPLIICVFLFLFQADCEQAHEARFQDP